MKILKQSRCNYGRGFWHWATVSNSLAKQGCHLSLSDINEKGLQQTVELLKPYSNITVTTKKLDVSDREAVKQWAQETVQDHGSVNLIFNNAGVALGSTVEGATYEDLEWIVGINFWVSYTVLKNFTVH